MKQLILIISLYFTFVNVNAQIFFTNLQEVFDYADKNSFAVKQGVVIENINHQETSIARSSLLPVINGFGSADYSPIILSQVVPEKLFGGSGGNYQKIQFGLPYNFSAGIEVNMPIINFEKWEQIKTAKLQTLTATLSVKTNIENLHISIIPFYYQALLYKELIALNNENEKAMTELLRIIELRKNHNILNPADYNRSQNFSIEIANAGVDYRKMYQLSLNGLKELLHISFADSIVLNESLKSIINFSRGDSKADIKNRMLFKEAEAKLAEAKQSLIAVKKSSMPKVSFFGKYAYQQQMKFGSEHKHVNFDAGNIGLRLNIPIFSGNYYKILRNKNEQLIKLAEIKKDEVKYSLQKQQADWLVSYKASISRQQQLENKIKFSSANLRIAKLSFNEGVMEYEELNTVFREHIHTQIESLQNIADGLMYKLLLTLNDKTL